MGSVHDVITEIISILNNDITDPNSTRLAKSLNWIYDDIPIASLSSPNYPRISVVSFGAPSVPHNICSKEQRVNVRTEIQIRVRRGKWNSQSPQAFLDDLTLDVLAAMANATSRAQLLANTDVFQSVLEAENTIYEDDVVIRQLIYKNVMVRTLYETLRDSAQVNLNDSTSTQLRVKI
jgi:hypothetical protein